MKRRTKHILLVQPAYPTVTKRKIRHHEVPIGLLKIGTYLRHSRGHQVQLVFGEKAVAPPIDEVWITSLFTYWSEYVHRSARYYRDLFPSAKIRIGGIYSTLLPGICHEKTGADVHEGLHKPSERWCKTHGIDYSLLGAPVDFEIIHGMRGCFRRCKFCGTWKLEPEETFETNIAKRVTKNHVIFYDNNFLRNPEIRRILKDLSEVRIDGRPVRYESQSGFDGRILDNELAILLKRARFVNPRIAWDNSLDDQARIHSQIQMLTKAGYNPKDIYVFILFNWEYDFNAVESKRLECWKWGVQIADCRFRPLTQLYDRFDSKKVQTASDYYIHPKWTDEEVKQYRSNVRRHNICVRHGFPFHSSELERMKMPKKQIAALRTMPRNEILSILPDAWFPSVPHPPKKKQMHIEVMELTYAANGIITQKPKRMAATTVT